MRVVLARGNPGKLRELAHLLSGLDLEIIPQSELEVAPVAETGNTFLENALLKARHASRVTGLPAIADDSGLVVDALGGAPGIHSARFAGEAAGDAENIVKLLAALGDRPEAERGARFLCTLVYLRSAHDPSPIICEGCWEGRVLAAPAGDGGFGYDPVFFVPERGCAAAELPAVDKNALSHRGRALRALAERLAEGTPPHAR